MTISLFNFIKNKLIKRKIVIFGEVHGTKEIPLEFSDFLSKYILIKDFNLCLEIPSNEQGKINEFLDSGNLALLENTQFFSNSSESDGRNSIEIIKLINKVYELNKKYDKSIKVQCVDLNYDLVVDELLKRDEIIVNNIKNALSDFQTLVLLGNFHAMNQKFVLNGLEFETVGSILKKEFGNHILTVDIAPKKGEFFNINLKRIEEKEDSLTEFYDYTYYIPKVSPCSFLEKH